MAAKDKVFRQVKQLLKHVDDQATAITTLTANAAVNATSVTVASIAGLNNGDTFRVGSGEDLELCKINGAPSGSTVNLTNPLAKAHITGEFARRQISYDNGDPTEDGLTVTVEGDNVDVNAATRRTVFTQLKGYTRGYIEGGYIAFTVHNLVTVLGMLLSRVTGAGTTSSPYQVITAGDEFGEDVNASVSVNGLLVDGTFFHAELHGVDFDHSVVKSTLTRATLASLPFKCKASSQVVFTTVDPSYAVDSSHRATKGKTFDAPSEVGLYTTKSGLNTTLNGAVAAGANAFVVVDSTGAAPGDRFKLSSNETAEVHIVDTVPDGTHITTRTKTLRAFGVGTTAVEVAQTPFAGMSEDGLSLEIGGDKRDVKKAVNRMEAGSIPGIVTITLSFMLIDLLLSNIAYALGAPQSAIVSGRLVVGNNIGASDIGEVYARGLQQDGTTVEVEAYGCSQQIVNFAEKLNQKDILKVPLTVRPASCLAIRQYQ